VRSVRVFHLGGGETGLDRDKVRRLPDTTGMTREVIVRSRIGMVMTTRSATAASVMSKLRQPTS